MSVSDPEGSDKNALSSVVFFNSAEVRTRYVFAIPPTRSVGQDYIPTPFKNHLTLLLSELIF